MRQADLTKTHWTIIFGDATHKPPAFSASCSFENWVVEEAKREVLQIDVKAGNGNVKVRPEDSFFRNRIGSGGGTAASTSRMSGAAPLTSRMSGAVPVSRMSNAASITSRASIPTASRMSNPATFSSSSRIVISTPRPAPTRSPSPNAEDSDTDTDSPPTARALRAKALRLARAKMEKERSLASSPINEYDGIELRSPPPTRVLRASSKPKTPKVVKGKGKG